MEQNHIQDDINIKGSLEIREFLDEMLFEKESNEMEVKSAKSGFPGSFWETYSSFTNSDGGVAIFGVREKTELMYNNNINLMNVLP